MAYGACNDCGCSYEQCECSDRKENTNMTADRNGYDDDDTAGYGTGAEDGDGYGDGASYCTSSGYGYSYGDGHGSGHGDGNGYGHGDGDGYGAGYGSSYVSGYGGGYGDGHGDGAGYGAGYGSGYGSGYGYGDGYGYGLGDGSGYGYGLGDGAGYGYGHGVPVATLGEREVRAVITPWGRTARVGCQVHGLDTWREQWREIARDHDVTVSAEEAARLIALIEAAPMGPEWLESKEDTAARSHTSTM